MGTVEKTDQRGSIFMRAVSLFDRIEMMFRAGANFGILSELSSDARTLAYNSRDMSSLRSDVGRELSPTSLLPPPSASAVAILNC